MSKCDEIKMPLRSEGYVFKSDMHFSHSKMGKTVKKIDIKLKELDPNDLKGIPSLSKCLTPNISEYIKYLDETLPLAAKNRINFNQLSTAKSLNELFDFLGNHNPEILKYMQLQDFSYRGASTLINLLNPEKDFTINPALYGKNKMSYTLKFFYTEGHTFTASNVNNHTVGQGTIIYYTNKETDTVHSSSQHRVFVDDLLYVEVHKPNGGFEVIPGLIKSFSAVPNAQEMTKVNNVVANENQHKEAAAKRHDKNVKSIAAKRKAQRARELGVTIADLENIGAMQKAERTRIAQEKKAKKNTSA